MSMIYYPHKRKLTTVNPSGPAGGRLPGLLLEDVSKYGIWAYWFNDPEANVSGWRSFPMSALEITTLKQYLLNLIATNHIFKGNALYALNKFDYTNY
ncbi:hypothetical protein KA005_04580 [bacterium]|nr:hypothetical protein [bacterium]